MASELLQDLEKMARALRAIEDAKVAKKGPRESGEEFEILRKLAGKWRMSLQAVEEEAAKEIDRKMRDNVLAAGVALLDDERNNLEAFLRSVAGSMVDSQRDLDRRSLDYIASLDERLTPAQFAIPSLKAELKVGLSQVTEKGLNLILFTREEQRKEYSESTVSFEVTTVPPPPAQVIRFPSSFILQGSGFLLSGDEKSAVLERTQAIAADHDKVLGAIYETNRQRALVFRHPESAEESPARYLVVWPGKREDHVFWDQLAVFALQEGEAGLELDKIFEPEDEGAEDRGFFVLTRAEEVAKLGPEKAARLAIAAGDAIDGVLAVIDGWLERWGRSGPAGQRPPGRPDES